MNPIGALALLAGVFSAAPAAAAKPRFIDVALIASSETPKPGGSALVGLRMVPKPGWHSYWSNPGEAGFPTVVEWSAPEGVGFGPLRHPAPGLIQVAGITSYVHEGPHVLVARMTLDEDIPKGTEIPIKAEVSWAACSDKMCVPEKATLTLRLTAGDGAPSTAAPLLRRAAAREPQPVEGGRFDVEGGNVTIELPSTARLSARRTRIFPDANEILVATQVRVISTSPFRLSAPAAGRVPAMLTGVATDGSSAYRFRLARKPIAVEEADRPEPPASLPQEQRTTVTEPAGDRPASTPPEPTAANDGESTRSQIPLAIPVGLLLAALGTAAVLFRRSRAKRS